MMTKKREMAEWILDFFRRAKADTGHIVMMRNVQNKLLDLNPRERDLFVPVANELIANGYFNYEEGALQSLRLTQKGRDYIYTPDAELDCCQDEVLTPVQKRYLADWHRSFIIFINSLKTFISGLMLLPEATEEDKRALERCLLTLSGKEVQDVEKALREGNVSKTMLSKVEKINKDLVDEAVEHLRTDVLVKEFWRQLSYLKIEHEKLGAEARLNALKLLNK